MELNVLLLNCTLKKTPEISNTEAFLTHAATLFRALDVATECLRVVDYNIFSGTTCNKGIADEWTDILEKIRQADMLIVATPLCGGDRTAITNRVTERLHGIMKEGGEETRKFPTQNKVAGVMVNGNKDAGTKAVSSILSDLSELGFTVPENASSYCVDRTGPNNGGLMSIESKHPFTDDCLLPMIHNMVTLARSLKQQPYTTITPILEGRAAKMS